MMKMRFGWQIQYYEYCRRVISAFLGHATDNSYFYINEKSTCMRQFLMTVGHRCGERKQYTYFQSLRHVIGEGELSLKNKNLLSIS